jgi:amino acid transporter
MFGAVVFETMAVVSIFVLRRTMPDAERPYRCWGYPVVPALYVLLPACVLVNYFVNERAEALGAVAIIALGVIVYYSLGLSATGPPRVRLADVPPDASTPFAPTTPGEDVTTDRRATTGVE